MDRQMGSRFVVGAILIVIPLLLFYVFPLYNTVFGISGTSPTLALADNLCGNSVLMQIYNSGVCSDILFIKIAVWITMIIGVLIILVGLKDILKKT